MTVALVTLERLSILRLSVDGGRYGNIITYGVKMTDSAGAQDFTSMTFNISWEDVGGDPQYAFWGQFGVQNDD